MPRLHRLTRTADRGSASTELVLLAGLVLMFAVTLVGFGRIALADLTVQTAANSAARDASLARTTAEAQSAALNTANASLDSAGLNCQTITVAINTSNMDAPLGQTGTVEATIECNVNLSDISVPGLPGSKLISVTASSPVDPYRERR